MKMFNSYEISFVVSYSSRFTEKMKKDIQEFARCKHQEETGRICTGVSNIEYSELTDEEYDMLKNGHFKRYDIDDIRAYNRFRCSI